MKTKMLMSKIGQPIYHTYFYGYLTESNSGYLLISQVWTLGNRIMLITQNAVIIFTNKQEKIFLLLGGKQ